MPRKRKTQPGDGGAYANRSDMAAPPQAAQVPTGLPYGEGQALEQSQQQAPVAGDPFQQILAAAQQHDFQPVGLNAPTERPNEPITAGLATGPGPGPEAMGQKRGISDILANLYNQSGNETIAMLLDRARRMGI